MKKRIILFTSSIVLVSGMLMSYDQGPLAEAGQHLTGAGMQAGTCMTSGCHSGGNYINAGLSVTLTEGTNPTPLTTWEPGHTYNVIIAGTSSAPKFGFQFTPAWMNGTTKQSAGVMAAVSSNTHVLATGIGNFSVLEHSDPLNVTTGGFLINATWTAPAVTTIDTVDFYLTVNNVNGNGNTAGDNSTNTKISYARNTTSVAQVTANIEVKAYPNPVTDRLNIELNNAGTGLYTIKAFDMTGREVAAETATVNKSFQTSINTSSWNAGIYYVQLSKDGAKKTIAVVKQ